MVGCSFATLALASLAATDLCAQPRIQTVDVNAPGATSLATEKLADLNEPHGLAAINDTIYVLNAGALEPSILVSQFTESAEAIGSNGRPPQLVATAALPGLGSNPAGSLYRLGVTVAAKASPAFAISVSAVGYGQANHNIEPLYTITARSNSSQAVSASTKCVFSDAQGLATDPTRRVAWLGFAQSTPSGPSHSVIVRLPLTDNAQGACETVRVPWASQITGAVLDSRTGCAYFVFYNGLTTGEPAVARACYAPLGTPAITLTPVVLKVGGSTTSALLTSVIAIDIDESGGADGSGQLLMLEQDSGTSTGTLWAAPLAGGEATAVASENEALDGGEALLASPSIPGVVWIVTSSSQLVVVCRNKSCGCASDPSHRWVWFVVGATVVVVGCVLVFWVRRGGLPKRCRSKRHQDEMGLSLSLLTSELPQKRSISSFNAVDLQDVLASLLGEYQRSLHVKPSDLEFGPVIGQGASGRVYRARHMGSDVAVKELVAGTPEQQQEREATLRSFAHEAKLLAGLHHTNVLRLLGVSMSGSYYYLVTELCKSSLDNVVSRAGVGAFGRPKYCKHWLRYAKEIARAMEYLHARGVVHRDLKDGNVLLDASGTCKVADFGLGAMVTKLCGATPATATLTRGAGTPAFMAPEVMDYGVDDGTNDNGTTRYSGAIDVYSYGIMMWRVWTGKRPFADVPGSLRSFLNHVAGGGRPPVPPTMSAALQNLLRQCWHHDPGQRPSFASIVHTLSGLDADDCIYSTPAQPVPRPLCNMPPAATATNPMR